MSRPAFHMPRTVTRAVHLALFGLTITPLAMVPNQVIAQTEIAQSQVATYSIAAGPLGTVLSEFATAAGVTLSFAAQQTQGINSQGLQGTYSVDQGLSQLLTGSALKAQLQSNGSYVLVKSSVKAKPLSETLELGAIEVSATSFGATTEGTGLYTTSSTATATGLNLSLRETPQSVTVITRQRMDDQALNSLGMVLDQTPGVSHSSGTDYAGYTYTYSRGYRIANFDVDGIPGTGGMSVGGLGGWYDVSSLETALYDSVTIIRGATGLLHGAGDPSGSISLMRKKPTHEFQASVEAGIGSWNKRRTVGDISGPLNQAGTVRGRVVGVYNEGESWKDRFDGDRSVAYSAIEADLTDNTLFRLTLDHQNIDSTGDAQGTFFPILMTDGSPSPFSASDNAVSDWTRFQRESTSMSARLEHSFNQNWQVTLDYSRLWGENEGIFGNMANALYPDGRGSMHLRNYSNDQEWEGINLKLNGNYALFGKNHDLVVGLSRDTIQLDSSFIRDMSQFGS